MAWLRLSLLGPREARESRGILCSETAASGTRLCGPGRGGDQAGRSEGGQAGPFVIAAACQAKMLRMMKEHSESLAEPSHRSGLPDSRLLIQPRAATEGHRGGDVALRGALSFLWALFPTDQWD